MTQVSKYMIKHKEKIKMTDITDKTYSKKTSSDLIKFSHKQEGGGMVKCSTPVPQILPTCFFHAVLNGFINGPYSRELLRLSIETYQNSLSIAQRHDFNDFTLDIPCFHFANIDAIPFPSILKVCHIALTQKSEYYNVINQTISDEEGEMSYSSIIVLFVMLQACSVISRDVEVPKWLRHFNHVHFRTLAEVLKRLRQFRDNDAKANSRPLLRKHIDALEAKMLKIMKTSFTKDLVHKEPSKKRIRRLNNEYLQMYMTCLTLEDNFCIDMSDVYTFLTEHEKELFVVRGFENETVSFLSYTDIAHPDFVPSKFMYILMNTIDYHEINHGYDVDHAIVSIGYKHTNVRHAIIATICNVDGIPSYVIYDSNTPNYLMVNWTNIDNLVKDSRVKAYVTNGKNMIDMRYIYIMYVKKNSTSSFDSSRKYK